MATLVRVCLSNESQFSNIRAYKQWWLQPLNCAYPRSRLRALTLVPLSVDDEFNVLVSFQGFVSLGVWVFCCGLFLLYIALVHLGCWFSFSPFNIMMCIPLACLRQKKKRIQKTRTSKIKREAHTSSHRVGGVGRLFVFQQKCSNFQPFRFFLHNQRNLVSY